MLHHGCLLYSTDLSTLERLLNVDQEKFKSKGYSSVRSRVTNLKPFLPSNFTISDLKKEISKGIDGIEAVLSEEEWKEIEEISSKKFRTWEWNWGSSPEFSVLKMKRFPWGKIQAYLLIRDGFIRKVEFYGDFFGTSLVGVQQALEGTRFRKDDVAHSLEGVQIGEVVFGAETPEIMDLLFD
jgi:lipoate-protein ligase A